MAMLRELDLLIGRSSDAELAELLARVQAAAKTRRPYPTDRMWALQEACRWRSTLSLGKQPDEFQQAVLRTLQKIRSAPQPGEKAP